MNDCEVLPADLFMKNPQKLPVNPQTVTVASEGFGTDPHTPRGDFSRGITLKLMCAYIHLHFIYPYTCIYKYTYISCKYTYFYVCVYVNVYIYIILYMCIYYIYVYILYYMCIYYIYIYVHMYISTFLYKYVIYI